MANAPGPFTVNHRCIDCGTCWQFDPQHFAPTGSRSQVIRQPEGAVESRQALLALQACPVAAIGTTAELRQQTPIDGFPALVTRHAAGDVYYCGWASRRSFGASSWLVVRPEGNVLIDSPRWSAPLARRISALGGLQTMVLTHRDDVADHQRWAKAFGCSRWIHQADADAAPGAEHQVSGLTAVALDGPMQLIPCPGHTAGSMAVLLGESRQVLFSGDHLWWRPAQAVVVASERYCWWDFQEQLRSVERLQELDVAWLLPGHGHAHSFAPGEWRSALGQTLVFNRRSPCC
ncbi:MBL fold metallo-hydrolase [Synechococcus sp. A10-1-5-1]|uniref:MBL fold metallo-hydrolase n=1 Tax=Synechococcus sp. A10-1-5-1 TaxID=2936507 RepID=UPI0020007644|nr:MBL fold metallo-hydrolase [Synechococcus sp. A10-1-5-1]UPM50149.1 MBL fold metallo-hydrolase [Synechococcus sp. A10-1-5-1]